jgi:hypothetical protein
MEPEVSFMAVFKNHMSNEINPVRTCLPYFFKIHFSIILSCTPRSSAFRLKLYTHFSSLSRVQTCCVSPLRINRCNATEFLLPRSAMQRVSSIWCDGETPPSEPTARWVSPYQHFATEGWYGVRYGDTQQVCTRLYNSCCIPCPISTYVSAIRLCLVTEVGDYRVITTDSFSLLAARPLLTHLQFGGRSLHLSLVPCRVLNAPLMDRGVQASRIT